MIRVNLINLNVMLVRWHKIVVYCIPANSKNPSANEGDAYLGRPWPDVFLLTRKNLPRNTLCTDVLFFFFLRTKLSFHVTILFFYFLVWIL